MRIDLVVKKDCALCDEAREALAELAGELAFEVKEIDLESDPVIHARYRYDVPVALLEGKVIAKHRIDARELRRRLPASYRQRRLDGSEAPMPVPESSGIRPVVRVSISQVAAASSARQQVSPSPYAKKKKEKKVPAPKPLPPLRLPPVDGRIFEVEGFLGTAEQRRMASWVEGEGDGPRVHVGPALGRVVVPENEAEAFQEKLLGGGYSLKAGPAPSRALTAAGISLVLGLLAWFARTTIASFPLAAAAAAASLLPLVWVAGGRQPLRLLATGSVLSLAASAVLWVDAFSRGAEAAIEWAAAPAFAQGLLLALALGLRSRQRGALEALEERMKVATAESGEKLELQPGDTLRADGRLLEAAEVDESILGGDATSKQAGELVWAGSRFPEGGSVRVNKKGPSRLERALALSARALGTSAPRPDAPLVRFLPLVALAGSLAAGFLHGAQAAGAALAVVPAIALALSVSFAETSGILAALRSGVAVRSAAVLRRAAKVRRVLLGKRAALERGDPLVLSTLPRPGFEPDEVLRLAGLAARTLEHPICRAVVAHAEELGLLEAVEVAAESTSEAGATKTVEGKRVQVGTLSYLTEKGIDLEGVDSFTQAIGRRGSSPAGVAIDGELALLAEMGDRLAAHGRSAIGVLEGLGSEVRIASGGPQASGTWSAEAMGLDASAATGELSAEGKAELVERLHPVLFAGGFKDDWRALEVADLSLHLGSDLAPLEKVDALALLPDARTVAALQRSATMTRLGVRAGIGVAWGGALLGLGLVLAGTLSPIGAVVLSAALSAASLGLAILPSAFFR